MQQLTRPLAGASTHFAPVDQGAGHRPPGQLPCPGGAVGPRAEANEGAMDMISARLAFLRRIALLVGALVLLRAVTGCAAAPEVPAPPEAVMATAR